MSGFLYPVHEGCGGPLVPVVAVPGADLGAGGQLICGKCHGRTDGRRGDLGQASLAALAEVSMGVPPVWSPSMPRPGVAKTLAPAPREEQLELAVVLDGGRVRARRAR